VLNKRESKHSPKKTKDRQWRKGGRLEKLSTFLHLHKSETKPACFRKKWVMWEGKAVNCRLRPGEIQKYLTLNL
jgi:hypothetical protein